MDGFLDHYFQTTLSGQSGVKMLSFGFLDKKQTKILKEKKLEHSRFNKSGIQYIISSGVGSIFSVQIKQIINCYLQLKKNNIHKFGYIVRKQTNYSFRLRLRKCRITLLNSKYKIIIIKYKVCSISFSQKGTFLSVSLNITKKRYILQGQHLFIILNTCLNHFCVFISKLFFNTFLIASYFTTNQVHELLLQKYLIFIQKIP